MISAEIGISVASNLCNHLPCVCALFRLIYFYRLQDMFLVSKLVFPSA